MSRHHHHRRRDEDDNQDERDEERDEEQGERREHRRHRHRRHHKPSGGFMSLDNLSVAAVCLALALLAAMVGITYLGGQHYYADVAATKLVQEETKKCYQQKRIPIVNHERTLFYCVSEADTIIVLGSK